MPSVKLPVHDYGVVVDLRIAVARPRADRMRIEGRMIPEPIDVIALIDTGADITLFDDALASQLKLIPRNIIPIRCLDIADSQEQRRPGYDVDLRFVVGSTPSIAYTWQIASLDFSNLPYKALLGRDLLTFCRFDYDGPSREVTFTI